MGAPTRRHGPATRTHDSENGRMAPLAQRTLVRYGMALAAIALVVSVKVAVLPVAGAPFPLFLGAVLFSAWFGGTGPGLFATLLALAAADYFFIEPVYSISVGEWGNSRLLQFEFEGLFIS